MGVFLIVVMEVLLVAAIALGVCDIAACIPDLPEGFAACRKRLLRGCLLLAIPAALVMLPLLGL